MTSCCHSRKWHLASHPEIGHTSSMPLQGATFQITIWPQLTAMLGVNPGWHVSLSLPDPLCVSKEIVATASKANRGCELASSTNSAKPGIDGMQSESRYQLLTTLKALHVWHLQDIHQIACHLVTSLGDNPQRKKHMVPCHMHCDCGLQWAPAACTEECDLQCAVKKIALQMRIYES